MSLADLLFGQSLASEEEESQRIGPLAGIPVLGLDALSSAAYGPEAALTLLLPLGALGLAYVGPISALIVLVLAVVYVSYRQTIAAYPNGGGSYTVAKENLGRGAALTAAAALGLDYVLNVAVGISAGVGALVSMFPALLPHTLALCLTLLALLTIMNLRGTREAGLAFMVPTYVFVLSLGAVIAIGVAKSIASGGHPVPIAAPPPVPASTEVASVWLVVRAFASGCTAMTGVEAVSNGVPLFRKPTVALAQRTLTLIIAILVGLLLGVAYLAKAYEIAATEPGKDGYQSLLSMLVAAVLGRGALYYGTLGAIVAVLALSANTSFADFPRLCRVLAEDRFLPDAFAVRGRRLVFSRGILVLAVLAALLLVAFGGITDSLIPLFAVGAFLAFTLSQAGMVVHWRRAAGGRFSIAVNAAGTLATGLTLVVVVVSKFVEGAWLTMLVVPLVVLFFHRVNGHYRRVGAEVACATPLDPRAAPPPIVVVPVQSWSRLAERGLLFAMRLSADVHAVQVLGEGGGGRDLRPQWDELVADPAKKAGLAAPTLEVLPSRYRQFFAPLLDYVLALRDAHPARDVIVVVPDLVVGHWYYALLHNNRGNLLKALFRLRGDARIVVVSTPHYLRD